MLGLFIFVLVVVVMVVPWLLPHWEERHIKEVSCRQLDAYMHWDGDGICQERLGREGSREIERDGGGRERKKKEREIEREGGGGGGQTNRHADT